MAIARADTVINDGDVNQFVKTAESGNHRIHAFDGTCGSQMFATDLDRSMFNILIGCLDQRAQIKPKRDIFERFALSFAKDLKKDKWLEKGLLSDLSNPLQ